MTRAPLLTLPILDGGHELSIRKLKLQDDSFTIHCSITPPLLRRRTSSSSASRSSKAAARRRTT